MEDAGSNVEIKHDPFFEANNLTDTIWEVMSTDRKSSMVATGKNLYIFNPLEGRVGTRGKVVG